MVSEGDKGMVEQIGDFRGDRFRVVIFAGHDHFRGFLADFLENFVIAPVEQFAGIGFGGGKIAAVTDHVENAR